jgi:hypothetical protein
MCTRSQRATHLFAGMAGRQRDDRGRGAGTQNALRGLYAVPVGHRRIPNDEVRVQAFGRLNRSSSGSRAPTPLGSPGRRLILAHEGTGAIDGGELHLLRDMVAGFSLALARNSEAAMGSSFYKHGTPDAIPTSPDPSTRADLQGKSAAS